MAIIVMVLVHFSGNLSGVALPIAGLGAPLFALLSGVSYRLWLNAQRARGRTETHISKVSVRRGLFVFGVGMAFNILVWLPEDTFNWDVLTFIGVALLLLNLIRRVPLSIALLIAGIVLVVSPILRGLADYDAYWVNGYFDGDLTLSDVLIGFLATGYFPLFPWLTFSIVGFVTASVLFPEPSAFPPASEFSRRPLPFRRVVGIGLALLGASAAAVAVRHLLPGPPSELMLGRWTMFPPTVVYVLGTLGMTLVLLGLAHRWVDLDPRAQRHRRALDTARMFSRNAFTIYVLHHVVHLWPLWIYGVATGNEPTAFWTQAMPLTLSLSLALLFLVLCYLVLRRLGPDRSYGIEAGMRWLCD